ncbi:MAG: DUF2141 domain-containing protein [Bacteroidia bacterium]|nr:DUF2141 domain-containing protein [Bacteroidia bacterium]
MSFSWSFAQLGSIQIEVTGLKSESGQLGYRLYKGANGFPNDSSVCFRKGYLLITKPMVFRIDSLPYGEYALALLHDENLNYQLDLRFTQTPKESIGYSNNGTVSFGPPSYTQAKFYLQVPLKKVTIKMRH